MFAFAIVAIALVLYYTILYLGLPLAIIFSIIAYVRCLKLKSYKVFRNIAIALYIPVIIVAIIYLFLMMG